MIELVWFSHEAWTGRWTRVAVGQALVIGSIDGCPRCDDPLSTTQNTRRADAYGSVVITLVTSSSNGTIPVFSAIVPISRPWWTS
jgi:hypothetical protein